MKVLGIDIGGTRIKGSIVNTDTGELLEKPHLVPTPSSLKPAPIVDIISDIADHFQWKGPIGCGYPGVVRQNVTYTATNFDKSWIGINLAQKINEKTGETAWIVNDADAAGIAEMTMGAGQNQRGVVIVLTIGTGIGSALFTDGYLLPNTEFGLIIINGEIAEKSISSVSRERENISWKEWAQLFDYYLHYLDTLFSPKLFIIGGGGAENPDKYMPYMKIKIPIITAQYRNKAGIIGAAMAAASQLK